MWNLSLESWQLSWMFHALCFYILIIYKKPKKTCPWAWSAFEIATMWPAGDRYPWHLVSCFIEVTYSIVPVNGHLNYLFPVSGYEPLKGILETSAAHMVLSRKLSAGNLYCHPLTDWWLTLLHPCELSEQREVLLPSHLPGFPPPSPELHSAPRAV